MHAKVHKNLVHACNKIKNSSKPKQCSFIEGTSFHRFLHDVKSRACVDTKECTACFQIKINSKELSSFEKKRLYEL